MVDFFDRWLLENRTPVVGGLLQRWGASKLGNQSTSVLAARTLARKAVEEEGGMREYALNKLRRFTSTPAREAICRIWVETRDTGLQTVLRSEGWTAENPVPARVLTLLNLDRGAEAAACSKDALKILINESRDPASSLREAAREALAGLDDDALIGRLTASWIQDRSEDLRHLVLNLNHLPEASTEGRVYAALLQARRGEITGMTPKVLSPLAAALHDKDEGIRDQARQAIDELSDEKTIKELPSKVGAEWAETRAPELEALILEKQFLARKPPQARVLTALKLGQGKKLHNAGADIVEPLLAALEDPDPAIREAAPAVLRSLSRESAQDAVCQAGLAGNAAALKAALAADYLPEDEVQIAGFLFLTEQWKRYDTFDFDRRLLRMFYEAAAVEQQNEITERIRKTGRTELLTVLSGGDFRSRAAEMREDEAEFMVGMLIRNREWPKLWKLVFELSLAQSVRSMQALAEHQWRPEANEDQAIYERLHGLLGEELAGLKPETVMKWIPPAVRRATAHIKGRVNDIAMSPSRPLIGIGTNDKRAALWNFQTGEIEESWRYKKVIGRVAFTADDRFVAVEGKATGHESILRVYGKTVLEYPHPDMVTGVEPAGSSQLLISRRDNTVLLFDAESGHTLGQDNFDFWCREICVAPDGKSAMLMHEGLTIVELPSMTIQRETTQGIRGGSVIKCGACTPSDGEEYLIGMHNGNVLVVDGQKAGALRVARHNLYQFGEVAGVASLPQLQLVIAASMGKSVHFYDWTTRQALGEIEAGSHWSITSLHVSPSGDFVSVGHRDDTMSFWDMRVVDIPRMFAQPLAAAAPRQLGAVQAMRQEKPHEKLEPALAWLECVLQYRFRYDIEIDELQSIRAGEFDIEIE